MGWLYIQHLTALPPTLLNTNQGSDGNGVFVVCFAGLGRFSWVKGTKLDYFSYLCGIFEKSIK